MESLKALMKTLAVSSTSTEENRQHFHKLQQLVEAQDYAAIREHILPKCSGGIFVRAYNRKLPALLPHVTIGSMQGAQMRLNVLINAINTSDVSSRYENVAAALDHGSAIILRRFNDYSLTCESSPLLAALQIGDIKVIKLLLSHGATFTDAAEVLNVKLNQPGSMALAIENKNIALADELLKHGYRVSENDLRSAWNHKAIYYKLKAQFKERKKEIIASSQNQYIFHRNHNLVALFSCVHVEDPELKTIILRKLDRLYSHKNKILKPLLDVAILGAKGLHSHGAKTQRNLKILVSHGHVYELTGSGQHTYGVYNNRSSVYVSGSRNSVEAVMGTIVHELKHFADKQLYGKGHAYPLRYAKRFAVIKARLKMHCEACLADAKADETDKEIYKIFMHAFTLYEPSEHASEILVRVAQVLASVGITKGYAWLHQHEPALLKFYEKVFNHGCEAYLRRVKQGRPVSLELPPPALAITR